jgi:putative SOS response-associated peptidase YedK
MCGRYAASRKPEDLVELFGVARWDATEALAPDWNVAPTKPVHAVLERAVKEEGPEPVRQLRSLRWGLVPSWAKSPEAGARMFNARAETLHEKPAYRRPFAARRCLLPADGYYEWFTPQAAPGTPKSRVRKQPYFISRSDGAVLAMAGLYEFWHDRTLPEADPAAWWATCTVITTAAEPGLARIHDRMPLILPADVHRDWLDPRNTDPGQVRALLEPIPPGLLEARPVSPAVGNFRNNGPELTEAVAPQEEGTLF